MPQNTTALVEMDAEGRAFNVLVQPWISLPVAKKSRGPQQIGITFVELFYDLIFAAVLSSFAYNIAFGWPHTKWINFVEMLMLLALWHDNVVFTSTAYAQDGVSMFVLFLQCVGVLGMGFFRTLEQAGGGMGTLQGFVVSFLWARAFQIVLYAALAFGRGASQGTRVAAGGYALWLAVASIPAAVTLGSELPTALTLYQRVMIWLVGAGLEHLVAFLLPMLAAWRHSLPLADLVHFRDRFGTLLLFLFGYMLTALFYDEQGPWTAGEWGSLALFFLIAFGFMWLYYNDRNDDERFGAMHPLDRRPLIWGHVWQALHLPLAMALIIMASASVQIVFFYRVASGGEPALLQLQAGFSNPPVVAVGPGEMALNNTVQWIYGVSFGVALGLESVIALLYAFDTRRHSKRRLERVCFRFALVLVMVLLPLGGLSGPLTPIIQPIVGGVVLLVLAAFDWACTTALAPELPDKETRRVVVPVAAAGPGPADPELRARIARADEQIAALQQQLAEAQAARNAALQQAASAAAARAAPAAAAGGPESSEISSSKEWDTTSATSSDDMPPSEGSDSEGDRTSGEQGSGARKAQPARRADAQATSSEDTP